MRWKIVFIIAAIAVVVVGSLGWWMIYRRLTDLSAPLAVSTATASDASASEEAPVPFQCGDVKIADLKHAKLSEFASSVPGSREQAAEKVAKSRWVFFLPEDLDVDQKASPDTVYDLTGSDCWDLNLK